MQGLYLLWFIEEKQLSPAVVAMVLAAGDLALIGFEVPTGWFADRFGHRVSLALGSFVQTAGMLCCWLGEGVPALVVASLLVALGDGFRSGADQALLYRSCVAICREESFQTIEGRTRAIEQAALVFLVIAGGGIVHLWGFSAAWAAEVALCAIGLLLALLMTEPPPVAQEPIVGSDPAACVRTAARGMLSLLLPAAFLGAASSAASFLVQTGGTRDAAHVTALVAGITLAEAAGAAAAARIPMGEARVGWGLATAGAGLLLVGVSSSLMLTAVAVALSFLVGLAYPLRAAAIQRVAADAFRARATSLASACDMLLSTIALPIAGVWRMRRRGPTI